MPDGIPDYLNRMKIRCLATYARSLLIVALAGCTAHSRIAAHAKWRAPDSTLEENLLAARQLCPVGTTLAVARSRLGPDGHLANYHGPTLKGSGQTGNLACIEAPNHDDWALEYDVGGGKICLFLEPRAGNANFDDSPVTSIRSMKRIHVGETP